MIEASEIPEEEKVYLKKDWMGWRVVHPLEKFEWSKEWLKRNWILLLFGSKSNMIFLGVVLLLGLGLYFGVNELISNYKAIADNPCLFCKDCASAVNSLKNNWSIIGINLTE